MRSGASLLALLLSGCAFLPLTCSAIPAAMYPSPFSTGVIAAMAVDAYRHDFRKDQDATGASIIACGYAAGLGVIRW